MSSFIVKTILLVTLVAIATALSYNENEQHDCPANENYYTCSLVKCPSSCDHLEYSKACPMLSEDCYQPACECINGYLRNANGKCIPEENCFDLDKLHRIKNEVPKSAEWEYIDV